MEREEWTVVVEMGWVAYEAMKEALKLKAMVMPDPFQASVVTLIAMKLVQKDHERALGAMESMGAAKVLSLAGLIEQAVDAAWLEAQKTKAPPSAESGANCHP
jgi:hypothetical protein